MRLVALRLRFELAATQIQKPDNFQLIIKNVLCPLQGSLPFQSDNIATKLAAFYLKLLKNIELSYENYECMQSLHTNMQ